MRFQEDSITHAQETSYYHEEHYKLENGNNALFTICDKAIARAQAKGENGVLYMRVQEYDIDTFNDILEQAREWEFQKQYRERWDPHFGQSNRDKDEESSVEIAIEEVLVKDGMFVGTVAFSIDYPNNEVRYALTESYDGEPVYCHRYFKYGSSDFDMYEETLFLLKPKEH